MGDDSLRLLLLKDSDIRLDTLHQCRTAIDRGIHIGGAFSAVVPLVALFYGGYIHRDIENPTSPCQDEFVLSKGHAVAAMASVYADLGYFPKSLLTGSRSWDSILNGHPGPVLPGVSASTGPLGHGISLACGFAYARKLREYGNVFCMTGDGELQEGSNWEGIQYASSSGLGNLCVLVDRNDGQSDCLNKLVVDPGDLARRFAAFGWQTHQVDGADYASVCTALAAFRDGAGRGGPTAIICNTRKGAGGFSSVTRLHKATIPDDVLDRERALQAARRGDRLASLLGCPAEPLAELAERMHYRLLTDDGGLIRQVEAAPSVPVAKKAPVREKRISCDTARLPAPVPGESYTCDRIAGETIAAYAVDRRVFSIDSDLANTSGLQAGVACVDDSRALNAGIAECHMMCMAEALAAEGNNVWTSTFGVFFDWRAFRRIAVSYQERLEAMAPGSWLARGHGLDITFLATAPNLETATNGATHMGNDDMQVYGEIAHLNLIDICCPRQLLAAMMWIMEGNRGLIYLRIPRAAVEVIYGESFRFMLGKGYTVRQHAGSRAVLVSSGRGVHEALAAHDALAAEEIPVDVVDMPSADTELLRALAAGGKPVVFAEQNNGYLYNAFLRATAGKAVSAAVYALNCKKADGSRQFIHSGTYPQLIDALGLSAGHLAALVRQL